MKESKLANNTWINTYEQVKEILLQAYGDVDPNFTTRTQIAQLKLQFPENILRYTKMFHELCTKITDEPLSQQAKLSAYLNGIQDRKLYEELIIEPVSGTRWTDFNKLYDYVMNKYSILQLHKSSANKKPDNPQQNRNWRRLSPHGMKTNIPSRIRPRPPYRLSSNMFQRSSRQPNRTWSDNPRTMTFNSFKTNPRTGNSRPNNPMYQRRQYPNQNNFNRHQRPNNNQMSNNYFKKQRGPADNFTRHTPQSGNNKPSHLAAMDGAKKNTNYKSKYNTKSFKGECPHCFQNHHPSQCPHQH
jgi:hypothetical protein